MVINIFLNISIYLKYLTIWRPENRKVPEEEVLHIYLYQDDLGKMVQPSPCSPFSPDNHVDGSAKILIYHHHDGCAEEMPTPSNVADPSPLI